MMSDAPRVIRAAKALDPIIIKGNRFFYTNGTQFFFRGIVYTTSPSSGILDPIGGSNTCFWDAPAMAALGVNVVVVTRIDLTEDHTSCMEYFQAAGIYVMIYLTGLAASRSLLDVASDAMLGGPSWNDDVYTFHTGVIDAFSSFPNVISFVLSYYSGFPPSYLPFLKAVTRDLKAYMVANNYRKIPLTLQVADGNTYTLEVAKYLQCGSDTESLDFWSIFSGLCTVDDRSNSVERATATYQAFGMPLVYNQSPTNCINSTFSWIGLLSTPQSSSLWSGNIADYWFYGGSYGHVTGVYNTTSMNKTERYTSLSKEWYAASATGIQASSYTPAASKTINCPTADATFAASPSLPTRPNRELCDCMMTSVTCAFPATVPDNTLYNIIDALCKANATNCIGIQANGTSGVYGAYSGCKSYQKMSWAIDRYAINAIANGSSTACNKSSYAKVQSLSVSPACSSMVLEAGVLGNNTVRAISSSLSPKSTGTTITTGGANSDPTSGSSPPLPSNHRQLSPAVYGVISAASIAVLTFIIGAIMCYRRVTKKRIALTVAEGLEVGDAPFGFGHVKTVELGGESRKSELWTNRNTTELPCLEVDVLDVGARGPPEGHTLLPPVVLDVVVDDDDDDDDDNGGDDIHGGEVLDGGATGSGSTSTGVDEAREVEVKIARKKVGSGKREKGEIVSGDLEVVEGDVEADMDRDRELDERARFTSSWSDGAWFDPNDARQVLSPGGTTVVRRSE